MGRILTVLALTLLGACEAPDPKDEEPPPARDTYALAWTCTEECDIEFPLQVGEELAFEREGGGGFFAIYNEGGWYAGGQIEPTGGDCFVLHWSGLQVPHSEACLGANEASGVVRFKDTYVQRTTVWSFIGAR
jgi:hypothetical protein